MQLIIHPPIPESLLAQARAIASAVDIINTPSPDEAKKAIVDAEAFYGWMTPEIFAVAKKLQWIQAPVAGLEKYIFPALRESEVILTNMRGIFSDHIADHVFAYILCFARSFHTYMRKQWQAQWEPNAPVIHLADTTIGILGFGGIGQAVAHRALAHEMRVIAVDPVPKAIEGVKVGGMDQFHSLLAQSDFVVSCAPHTPQTEKLIGTPQLQRMKRTAYLINISRGIIVDLQALTEALRAGTIAGAGLDVYEVEPLPADHPLWKMENVILTPHTAGQSPHYEERRAKVFLENLRRFVQGQPFINIVDKTQWFATTGEMPDTR
jgi:phosphoglycerate dehydrogenase-like enzyme